MLFPSVFAEKISSVFAEKFQENLSCSHLYLQKGLICICRKVLGKPMLLPSVFAEKF